LLSFEEGPDRGYPLDRLDPPVAYDDALQNDAAQLFAASG
jgi:hypothetical protein